MFSLTSTRLAPPSINSIGAAAIALLASANTFADAAENPSRAVQEHHACAVVLGLDPSGRLYSVCVSSLDKSLSELDQARLATRVDDSKRSACAQKGLTPGTPAFAVCVVDAKQSSVNAGGYGGGVPLR